MVVTWWIVAFLHSDVLGLSYPLIYSITLSLSPKILRDVLQRLSRVDGMSYYSSRSSPSFPYSYKMAETTPNTGPVKKDDDDNGIEKQGLWQFKAMLSLWLWYFFSTCTLFLNKHILVTMKGEPTLLSKYFSL